MIEKANQLHDEVGQFCFIARSLNFEVNHNPVTKVFCIDSDSANKKLEAIKKDL